MQLDLNNLPIDTELLHRLVRDIVGTIEHRESEIERLRAIIKRLQRLQFGRRSERIDSDQLALGLEDPSGADDWLENEVTAVRLQVLEAGVGRRNT
jgi:hypothetical protein